MKGDFSRISFDPKKKYTSVLMQQGRVALDSDWNEQAQIQKAEIRNIARDIIGPFGGPHNNCGFEISKKQGTSPGKLNDFQIGMGRYYVDGIACQNDSLVPYYSQPYYLPSVQKEHTEHRTDLVYLDLWQREITSLEDPDIREVALGGPDTAIRTKTVWQVKTKPFDRKISCRKIKRDWPEIIIQPWPANKGALSATIKSETESPQSEFTGLENNLYRIEIHNSGNVGSGATFKWSRDNGSVAWLIEKIHIDKNDKTILVGLGESTQTSPNNLGSTGLNWVEMLDNNCLQYNTPGRLYKVVDVKDDRTLLLTFSNDEGPKKPKLPAIIRRWDQNETQDETLSNGAIPIREKDWIYIESGMKIRFKAGGEYHSGDYWYIPARTDTKSITWPIKDGEPTFKPADGIYHSFAPLAIITRSRFRKIRIVDCRVKF